MSDLRKPVEILLVEDNPADIRLAREALREWKLKAEIQRDPDLRAIPVAVFTASQTDTEIVKRFALPTKCYIVKPLEIEAYLGAVRCFEQFSITIVSRPLLREKADASAT
jgi:CheY-like chemotaxis protein